MSTGTKILIGVLIVAVAVACYYFFVYKKKDTKPAQPLIVDAKTQDSDKTVTKPTVNGASAAPVRANANIAASSDLNA